MENVDRTTFFWSKGAGARLYRQFAGKYFLKLHQKIAEEILPLHPHDVLDIACGPGDFLLYLSRVAPNIKLTGSDIAHGMLKTASKKLRGRVNIVECKPNQQPFPDNSFDVITLMMAFHHFPNRLKTLRDIKRILRPGGTLIIVDSVMRSVPERKFWNALEKIISFGGYVEHYTEKDIENLAKQADFVFSIKGIEGMRPKYKICKFIK